MRVVFVNRFAYPDHSATSQILSDLAAGLAAQGMDVAIVCSRQRYDEPRARLPRLEQWRGVRIQRIGTSAFGRAHLLGRAFDYATFYLGLPWALAPLLRPGDIVVAKTDPPLVSLVAGLVARLRGATLVNWLQDVFPEIAVSLGQPPVPRSLAWLLGKLRNRSLRVAAMNVAIGERMAEYFLGLGTDAAKMRVIPNWAHEDSIAPMPTAASEMRARLGLQDSFVAQYSGNLGRAHDWETLFEAARQLEGTPGIAFVFVGGGHGYESLRNRVAQAGLGNVHFQPYQDLDRLSDSMAAADLHLVSLRPELEGQIVPSKFYGIAAAERAIGFVGDPDGELARLIAAGDCGFSVPSGRGDQLARAIAQLATDLESCREQGKRARKLLDERFSRERAHALWHGLLAELGATGERAA